MNNQTRTGNFRKAVLDEGAVSTLANDFASDDLSENVVKWNQKFSSRFIVSGFECKQCASWNFLINLKVLTDGVDMLLRQQLIVRFVRLEIEVVVSLILFFGGEK